MKILIKLNKADKVLFGSNYEFDAGDNVYNLKAGLSEATTNKISFKLKAISFLPFLTIEELAEYLRELIIKETGGKKNPLEGFKVLIDAGNGAAGFFAEEVIEKLGGDSKGSQFLNPDGTFTDVGLAWAKAVDA